MNKAEMKIKDKVFCIALLEGFNREEATKIDIKNIAQKKEHGNRSKKGPNRVGTDTVEVYSK